MKHHKRNPLSPSKSNSQDETLVPDDISADKALLRLVKRSPNIIAIFDLDGVFINVNDRLKPILGYAPEEVLGKSFNDLLHSDLLESEIHQWNSFLEDDTSKDLESEYRHKNGQKVYLSWSCYVSKNEGLVYAMGRDITAEKAIDAENDITRHHLGERIKELSLLYKFGHILQSPDFSLDEKLQQAVESMPDGWQYPHITAARIHIDTKVFQTSNYKETPFTQKADFKITPALRGSIEITYLKKTKTEDEGPFLKEERDMINLLSEMLCAYIKRMKEQELILKTEANLRSVFDNTDVGHILLDENFVVKTFNNTIFKGYIQMAGIEIKAGISLFDLVLPDRVEKLKKHFNQAKHQKEPFLYETTYTSDGKDHHYQLSLLPILEKNVIMGYCMSIYDTTKQKEAEASAIKQISLLKDLSFITSHELRHEYAKLRSMADYLEKRDPYDKELHEILRNSRDSFDRMNDSISKLNNKIGLSHSFNLKSSTNKYIVHGILLIDDDHVMNYLNEKILGLNFDPKRIDKTTSVDEAIEFLKNQPKGKNHLILLDINMPVKNGWDFLEEFKLLNLPAPVIILSSSIDPADRKKARSYHSVINFISKPLNETLVHDIIKHDSLEWE